MTRVFVQLQGGLGNQLFQYAAGRAVAIRTNSELLLDTRTYDTKGERLYSLDQFRIKARIATDSELPPPRTSWLLYEMWKIFGRHPRYVRERGLSLNSNLLSIGPECYLRGYFLSEGYFSDIANQIRRELTFKSTPDDLGSEMLDRIASENAVALHVRHGDFLTIGPMYYPVLNQTYYDAAISYISSRVECPVFHVFSDCPDWVRSNFQIDYPVVIHDRNQAANLCHEDLRMMSACCHNIIANSSFSWWGAWLNPNPDKLVVTPKAWYGERMPPVPDLFPSTWLRIPN